MAETFDPYHRWLGIPSREQRPNHYRLLGLVQWEDDPEVIRDGAERQMAHVRRYGLGQHAELSQRILNELAAAKACLMDPVRKAEYDRHLCEKLAASNRLSGNAETGRLAGERSDAPAAVSGASLHSPPTAPTFSDRFRIVSKRGDLRRPHSWLRKRLLAILGAAAALLLLIGLVVFVSGRGKSAAPVKLERIAADSEAGLRKAPGATVLRPPKIANIPDQTVDQGTKVQFSVVVSDRGTSGGKLRFVLGPGAPKGAAIDAQTGAFTWTPTKEQSPERYPITVQVLAEGSGNLGDQTTFHVSVQKVNKAPVIQPIAMQTVSAGSTQRFAVVASDPDGPSDKLTFSLPGAPEWVSIDPATGTVTCTPAEQHARRTYPVTVRVADGAPQPLQDEKTFMIAVVGPIGPITRPPVAPGDFRITFRSGKALSAGDFNTRDKIRSDTEGLLKKCFVNSPDAIGVWRDKEQTAISALCGIKQKTPHGAAVFFHDYKDPLSCYRARGGVQTRAPTAANQQKAPEAPGVGEILLACWADVVPKQYVTYENGQWDGLLATWNAQGEKEFWCWYSNGQRHGLCCLFKDDILTVVLECTQGKVDAVHLISDSQVSRSLAGVNQALSDDALGPLLKEIDAIESDLKAKDRSFRESLRKAVQLYLGEINRRKEEARRVRSAQHAEETGQLFRDLWQRSGLR